MGARFCLLVGGWSPIRKGTDDGRGSRGKHFQRILLVLVGTAALLIATNGAEAAPSTGATGTVQPVSGTSELDSVACTSTSFCVAVGSVNGEGVVVPIDNGVAGPAQAVSGTYGLTSVTCPAIDSCTAIGTAPYLNVPGIISTAGVLVGFDDGQAFVGGTIPGNGLPGAPDGVVPSGIACSDLTHCIAVGDATYELGFGINLSHGAPGTLQTISPDGPSGVECASEDWCVVDERGSAQFVQIADRKLNIRIGPSVFFDQGSNLYSGTCRNGTIEFCEVAGVVRHEGAVFSAVGQSSGVTRKVTGSSSLNDVACAGSYRCIAVGQTTSGDGAIVPIGWVDPDGLKAVAGSDQLNGVSCPSQNLCVAVGANASTGVIDTFPVWG
jgi:hypothetical protein